MSRRCVRARSRHRPLVTGLCVLLAFVAACVGVTYPGSGSRVIERPGETLVFGRVRFFHHGREYFPWGPDLGSVLFRSALERHLWLLRIGPRAVSAELHPDDDGSLAIWLKPGDYALLGSTELPEAGTAPFEVVALLRVPTGAAAYAGEIVFSTVALEGGHWQSGQFGAKTVTVPPVAPARATLERRIGALPAEPVVSAWCAPADLPRFQDADLFARGRRMLDAGCHSTH